MSCNRVRSRTSRSLIAVAGLIFAGYLVSGCATKTSPVAVIAASQDSLNAAGKTILACYSVPRCNAAAPKPAIRLAYDTAYDALTRAQAIADAGGTPDLVASTVALSALQVLVAQLPAT